MHRDTFKPRDLLNKEVAGICGVARMTDKARAANDRKLGRYKYGVDSKQDTFVLDFLGVSADEFKDIAVSITNDTRLGGWILDNCSISDADIRSFNNSLRTKWERIDSPQNNFKQRRRIYRDDEPPLWLFLISPVLWVFAMIFRRR